MPASRLEIMGPFTTAERDALVANGNMPVNTIILNSDTIGLERWDGGSWKGVLGTDPIFSGTVSAGSVDVASGNVIIDSSGIQIGSGQTIWDADGKIVSYNNVAVEGKGVPAIHDVVSLTGQTAAIASTNFANSGVSGLYRVSYYMAITTVDAGATGILEFSVTWNDGSSGRGLAGEPITVTANGHVTRYVHDTHNGSLIRRGSGNIAYIVSLGGSMGTAQYALYATLERLS